jgi:hypothetical protein
MKVRHVMGLSFAGVFLLTISLAGANTDVADAAMRKDRAAVQALLQKGAKDRRRFGWPQRMGMQPPSAPCSTLAPAPTRPCPLAERH